MTGALFEHHFGEPAQLEFGVWESGTFEREQDALAICCEGAPTLGRLRAHKTLVLAGLCVESTSIVSETSGRGANGAKPRKNPV